MGEKLQQLPVASMPSVNDRAPEKVFLWMSLVFEKLRSAAFGSFQSLRTEKFKQNV